MDQKGGKTQLVALKYCSWCEWRRRGVPVLGQLHAVVGAWVEVPAAGGDGGVDGFEEVPVNLLRVTYALAGIALMPWNKK